MSHLEVGKPKGKKVYSFHRNTGTLQFYSLMKMKSKRYSVSEEEQKLS